MNTKNKTIKGIVWAFLITAIVFIFKLCLSTVRILLNEIKEAFIDILDDIECDDELDINERNSLTTCEHNPFISFKDNINEYYYEDFKEDIWLGDEYEKNM